MVKLESTRHWGFSNIRLSPLLDVVSKTPQAYRMSQKLNIYVNGLYCMTLHTALQCMQDQSNQLFCWQILTVNVCAKFKH